MVKIGHDTRATTFAKWSVWFKNLKCKKGAKNDCLTTVKLIVQETAPKNTEDSKNESIFKMAEIGHNPKAVALAKWSVWLKN